MNLTRRNISNIIVEERPIKTSMFGVYCNIQLNNPPPYVPLKLAKMFTNKLIFLNLFK